MKYLIDNWDKVSTIFFAFLSAIFAGLSALILWLEYKRNNPKIAINMYKETSIQDAFPIETITCSITNKGRRPIKIKSFYFLLNNYKKSHFPAGQPMAPFGEPHKLTQTLNETEKYEFKFRLDSLKKSLQKTETITHLCFTDTADNVYKYRLKKKYWKDLIK